MIVFDAPDPRNGTRLAASIESATGHPAEVVLVDGRWNITTEASEADVRSVVNGHDGTPDVQPASTEDRLSGLEAEVRGIRERAAAADVTNADAKAVRDAVAGTP